MLRAERSGEGWREVEDEGVRKPAEAMQAQLVRLGGIQVVFGAGW